MTPLTYVLLSDMGDLTYLERLHEPNALTVANQCFLPDVVFTFKVIHKLVNCSAADLGIFPLDLITRGSGCRMWHRLPNSNA